MAPQVGDTITLPVESSAGQSYAAPMVVLALSEDERGVYVVPPYKAAPDYRRARYVRLDGRP